MDVGKKGGIGMNRLVTLMMVGLLAVTLDLARAASTPDATISLQADSVAAGIGISWGSGTLTYKGKTYPISADGLSVGDAGISKISASGKVYGLNKLEDFNGNYTGVAAGATVAGGGAVSAMQNQNGVRVELVTTTQGLKFTLGANGVNMKIKQ
jgi:hypothetical protein